jgi:hypothetical protein
MSKATPLTARTVKRRADKEKAPIGTPTKVSVRLDKPRYVKLKTYAAQHDMTGEEVIIAALDALMT